MSLFISLREAAELTGYSRPTLFRAVQKGELPVQTAQHGNSKKILVLKTAVLEWACSRTSTEQGEQPQSEQASTAEQPQEQVEQVPLLAHLDVIRLLDDTQKRLLEATERAHRAERQNDLLRLELHSTRNCLTETAQSSLEREALSKEQEELLERKREAERAWDHERELLQQENKERISLYEQEKQQWIQELDATRSRVDWLEKRVPRWVRSLFGAS